MTVTDILPAFYVVSYIPLCTRMKKLERELRSAIKPCPLSNIVNRASSYEGRDRIGEMFLRPKSNSNSSLLGSQVLLCAS